MKMISVVGGRPNLIKLAAINSLISQKFDHISDFLFSPTLNAQNLLIKENLGGKSIFTGDVTYDIFLKTKGKIKDDYIKKANLKNYQYYFATCHRQENTDNKKRLVKI